MKEETLKNDLEAGIEKQLQLINKIKPLGDRVIILLDKISDHTTTDSGIIVPLNEVIELESGRLGTETSSRTHLSQGTVVKMSALAAEKLVDVKEGDKVLVHHSATSKSHYFFPDRTKLVQDFNGFISIPHPLVEAVINEN